MSLRRSGAIDPSARPHVMLDFDPQLQELNFGELDGQSFADLGTQWSIFDAFGKIPQRTHYHKLNLSLLPIKE